MQWAGWKTIGSRADESRGVVFLVFDQKRRTDEQAHAETKVLDGRKILTKRGEKVQRKNNRCKLEEREKEREKCELYKRGERAKMRLRHACALHVLIQCSEIGRWRSIEVEVSLFQGFTCEFVVQFLEWKDERLGLRVHRQRRRERWLIVRATPVSRS